VNDSEAKSEFYSDAALNAGGRAAALEALDELTADLELLIVHLNRRIVDVEKVTRELEEKKFAGRSTSKSNAVPLTSRLLDDLSYFRKLRLACHANLEACAQRLRELQH
jgi:hypothetical protein